MFVFWGLENVEYGINFLTNTLEHLILNDKSQSKTVLNC